MLAGISGLAKYFGALQILADVSGEIHKGDKIGLIGVNGAGKSTLLDILCGELEWESGQVVIPSGVRIGYLKQNSAVSTEKTVLEELRSVFSDVYEAREQMDEITRQLDQTQVQQHKRQMSQFEAAQAHFLSRGGYDVDVRIATVMTGMGFSGAQQQKAHELSGGEKSRLAIAKLLLEEPDILVLDEPTNHLDFETIGWLEEYLRSYKGGIVIVSHDRYFLDRTVDSIWELENTKLYRYRGNYSMFLQQKQERNLRMQKEYEIQREKIASMEDYIARNIVRASTSNRAKSRVKALENMELVDRPTADLPAARFSFAMNRPSHKTVLEVSGLTLTVGEAQQERVLLEAGDLSARRGERIAIIGKNGVGKTTLFRALEGTLAAKSGTIRWGGAVSCSFYDQEQKSLHEDKTVIEEIWDRYPAWNQYQVRSALAFVQFFGDDLDKKVSDLSGGERARLLLGRMMHEGANVLLFDEPSNHLDFLTQEHLEEALKKFEGTIFFVSHDRYLINKLATKTVEICAGKLRAYEGNFEAYLAQRQKAAEGETKMQAEKKENGKSGAEYYRSKAQRADEARRRQRIGQLEELIEQTQMRMAALEQEIMQPGDCVDYVLLEEKCREMEKNKEQNEQHYEEWVQLMDSLEG